MPYNRKPCQEILSVVFPVSCNCSRAIPGIAQLFRLLAFARTGRLSDWRSLGMSAARDFFLLRLGG